MSNTPNLTKLFERHQNAVLAFSGGKDSLACLHLCQDYRDNITVVWVNTGAAFPHMVEFIRRATEGFNFVELKSDQAAWIAQQGLPADMIPVANSIWRDPGNPKPSQTLLQPWTLCCLKLRTEPVLNYLWRSGATLLLHGQRRSDGGGFIIDSMPGARVEICKLIWEWSDDDILDYIGKHGIELPEQYADGVMSSVDCWNCTALGDDSATLKKAKVAYMAHRYPDLLAELKIRMGRVFLATKAAFEEVKTDTAYVCLEAAEGAEKNLSVRASLEASPGPTTPTATNPETGETVPAAGAPRPNGAVTTNERGSHV